MTNREAVRRLFAERAGAGGWIRGLDERQYFEALDSAQAYHDRSFSAGVVRNYAGTSISYPYAGLGPTLHSAYANPDAQREHFLADPRRSGPENLRVNSAYLLDRLAEARRAGGPAVTHAEMTHLGAAAHALPENVGSSPVGDAAAGGAQAWQDRRQGRPGPEERVRE